MSLIRDASLAPSGELKINLLQRNMPFPREPDEAAARRRLRAMLVSIDALTDGQAAYPGI